MRTSQQHFFRGLQFRSSACTSALTRPSSSISPLKQAVEPSRPSIAPKVSIDLRHIREAVPLHERNCIDRNYTRASTYPSRIKALDKQWHIYHGQAVSLRNRNSKLQTQLANPALLRGVKTEEVESIRAMSKEDIIAELKDLKEKISVISDKEQIITAEIQSLAVALPNLTSEETPRGSEPRLIGYINDHPSPSDSPSSRVWRSHVEIGTELSLLDFSSSTTTTGWGFYYLLNEAVQLEQALIQFAMHLARKSGWSMVAPPSVVYSHIATACGFQPRDHNGEQQIYNLAQSPSDIGRKPELSLAGTAEIPLAGMKANVTISESELPLRKVGVSRSYRAEAGARGVDSKGLYRVHEFTKVELFAWTHPSTVSSTELFDEMLHLQRSILSSLGLHCRILEMPSQDLGASATRKIDIEAFFPSRRERDEGWGELTSVSMCGDYQTRRLASRLRQHVKGEGEKMGFPWTVNGTALAVPRVLAAILENGWDEERREVRVPECLWPWMDGIKVIRKQSHSNRVS